MPQSVWPSCLTWKRIAAVELGLSADSEMAGYISELDSYTFLTNSDAHSLGKIGREYNVIELARPSFSELKLALERKAGRRVSANFGLNPRLGQVSPHLLRRMRQHH